MGCCCVKEEGTHRITYFQAENNQGLPSNKVDTTKYSIITFLPKAIIFQFVRPANFVYLLSAILQSIPQISSLTPITAIAPFVFVIGISLIREGYEDYKRHTKDTEINTRITRKLHEGQFVEIPWEQVRVGDIIKVKNNQKVPADFLLLHSSEENSLCYVETANLDGESNLKSKFAYVDDIKLYPQEFQKIIGYMTVELPNSDLHSFSGMIKIEKKEEKHIDFENVLLRQTVLKNTEESIGVVIYTGVDTKIIQNQGDLGHKVSHVQRKVNVIQFILLIMLIMLSLTCSLGFNAYHNVQNNRSSLFYLVPQVESTTTEGTQLSNLVILIYFSSFLLLTFLIPISLNVSIEVIKAFLGIFLGFDDKMYYKPIDKRCNVLNISIIEELGQVDYVLTDKTGTLTANQMVFKYLTLGRQCYDSQIIQINVDQLKENKSFNDFWIGLLICHDVVCEPETGQYQGSSPDEVCFIKYAKTVGYEFVKRTKNSIELNVQGKKVVYELLTMLPFTSRKRMSVVVKNLDNEKIFIYTKGADSAIFEKAVQFTEQKQLKKNIDKFAMEGFRTLLFSYREISKINFDQLTEEKAIIKGLKIKKIASKQEIQEKQAALIEKYESNLVLLGSTAIEDRLQDDVPQTIARLQEAGIIVMMITGDKLQTAQNIGYLAHFIKKESKIFRIVAGETDITKILLDLKKEKERNQYGNISLIIEGSSISKYLNSQDPLHGEILKTVSSVIFCRSSPKQKSLIVKFVKQKLSGIVLAIGDGGNDVGMIQQAHVGVGILGKEGNSASAASDFSIGQFNFLDRLVLHHGRWFYYRLSYFFVYYGWKNLIMTLLLYFFMIDSAFSALPGLSEPFIAVYNIVIGLALVVYYSIFEQDINDDQYKPAWKHLPLFYKQTKQLDLFSYSRYALWTVKACVMSVIIFCITKFSVGSTEIIEENGFPADFSHKAEADSISLCLIVVMVLISDIKMYTYFSGVFVIGVLTVLGTVGFFLVESYLLSATKNYSVIQSSGFRFWLAIFLNFGIAYGGKLLMDTIHFESYQTSVERMLRKKSEEQQGNYIHMTFSSQIS